MALTPADHLRRATYNEGFARWLGGEKSKWPSWTMTALFYSAVHHADALLVTNEQRPRDHGERNDALLSWPTVRTPYMRLFQYSIEARYEGHNHDQKRLVHALNLLDDVKSAVAGELGAGLS